MKANRKIKVTGLWRNGEDVPWIRIAGKYLQKMGYQIGDYVEVIEQNNQIIIRKHHGENSRVS